MSVGEMERIEVWNDITIDGYEGYQGLGLTGYKDKRTEGYKDRRIKV